MIEHVSAASAVPSLLKFLSKENEFDKIICERSVDGDCCTC